MFGYAEVIEPVVVIESKSGANARSDAAHGNIGGIAFIHAASGASHNVLSLDCERCGEQSRNNGDSKLSLHRQVSVYQWRLNVIWRWKFRTLQRL
jgi:hypothetical protein